MRTGHMWCKPTKHQLSTCDGQTDAHDTRVPGTFSSVFEPAFGVPASEEIEMHCTLGVFANDTHTVTDTLLPTETPDRTALTQT